jgi:hypothetical protein
MQFKNCVKFVKEPVKYFFWKNTHFIYMVKKRMVNFCKESLTNCFSNFVTKGHNLIDAQIERENFLLTLQMKSTNVMAFGNFDTNETRMYHDGLNGIVNSQIINIQSKDRSFPYILQFLKAGFKIRRL